MTTTENKFQRQRRITVRKNLDEATRIMRLAVDYYCLEFSGARWAHICRGRNLCGLRAYALAVWACVVLEEFIEEE